MRSVYGQMSSDVNTDYSKWEWALIGDWSVFGLIWLAGFTDVVTIVITDWDCY